MTIKDGMKLCLGWILIQAIIQIIGEPIVAFGAKIGAYDDGRLAAKLYPELCKFGRSFKK